MSFLGASALRYNTRYGGQTDITSATQRQGQFGTLARRHRPSLDYASDTEATCSSSPKSAYYYYRHNMSNPPQSSAVSHLATLSRSQIGQSSSGESRSVKLYLHISSVIFPNSLIRYSYNLYLFFPLLPIITFN